MLNCDTIGEDIIIEICQSIIDFNNRNFNISARDEKNFKRYLCNTYKVDRYTLSDILKYIRIKYNVWIGQILNMDFTEIPDENPESICLISDVHYGSIFDCPELVEEVYQECIRRNIKYILCSGDFTDGAYPEDLTCHKSYRKTKSLDELAEYVVKTHTKLGVEHRITLIVINGYSEIRTIKKFDVLAAITEKLKVLGRNDILYVGQGQALANIKIGNLKVTLCHEMPSRRADFCAHLIASAPGINLIQTGNGHLKNVIHTDTACPIVQVSALAYTKPNANIARKKRYGCGYVIANIFYDRNNEVSKIEFEANDLKLNARSRMKK